MNFSTKGQENPTYIIPILINVKANIYIHILDLNLLLLNVN